MENRSNSELDYCDLEPGKLCDNCCRCLDTDKPYNELEADFSRTDRIDEGDGGLDLFQDDFYELYAEGEGEDCDSSRVPPIEIDPELKAEWERRLQAYETETKTAYVHTLRGARKRTETEKTRED